MIQWACAPAAQGKALVQYFSRLACAPVRGAERYFIKANVLFCVPKENQKSTSDFDALDPRERGCSPLSDPEEEVETEKS